MDEDTILSTCAENPAKEALMSIEVQPGTPHEEDKDKQGSDRHPGKDGFFDSKTPAEDTNTATLTTEHLPDDMRHPEADVSSAEDQKDVNWFRRHKKLSAALGATGAATAAAIAFFLPQEDDRSPQATKPSASSTPTPGASNTATPTPSGSNPATPVTPETTQPEAPLTATEVAKGLTPSAELYDQSVMQSLELSQSDRAAVLNRFADRYPSLSTEFNTVASEQFTQLETLTAEDLIGVQRRFNELLSSTVFTDESIAAGDPKLVELGTYFSSGPYESEFPFPNGTMSPQDIQAYDENMADPAPNQTTASFLTLSLDDGSRMQGPFVSAAKNNQATTDYIIQNFPEDQREKARLSTANPYAFHRALFVNDQGMGRAGDAIDTALNPATRYASCGEGIIVNVYRRDVPFGPTTIPLNAITFACEQPDAGAGEFLLKTVVNVPVDSYLHGKKTNQQVLQPVTLDSHAFKSISR